MFKNKKIKSFFIIFTFIIILIISLFFYLNATKSSILISSKKEDLENLISENEIQNEWLERSGYGQLNCLYFNGHEIFSVNYIYCPQEMKKIKENCLHSEHKCPLIYSEKEGKIWEAKF